MAVVCGHAAMSFSIARGSASRKVCIGVLPKHQRPWWTVPTYGAAFKSSPLILCAVAPPPFAPAVVMRRYPMAATMRDIVAVGVGVTRARAERAGHGADRAADNC